VTTGLRPDVVITGIGTACAIGTGCHALWDALASGRDALRRVTRFSVQEFTTQIAGLWPEWDGVTPEACTALELAAISAREAWATARASGAGVPAHRVALILGTCFGESYAGFSEIAQGVARRLGAEGPSWTVPTACAASTTAIGMGRDLIEEGVADLVVAGGVDVITREIFAGFHALGALSCDKCSPFGASPGMSLGEGSGFVVLETLERARARSVRPVAHLLGYGLSADAYHATAPDPSGSGVARAIRAALADAATPASEVNFVSAHGSGTDANDAAEWLAVRSAIGEQVPMSSSKSFFGHAQGAAGVLELAALLLCMQRGSVPPTLRAHPPRAGAPADPVAGDRPRAYEVRSAVKLSAAFGGANAALVISRKPVARTALDARPVQVAGLAALSPHGLNVEALEAGLAAGRRLEGRLAAFDLGQLVRSAPQRDLDPSGKYVSAGAALALADAETPVRGAFRERCGIFTGNTRMSPVSVRECRASVERRGILGVASVPFSRMVLNAPAGMCAKLLSLKGPLLVVSAGRASGLLAIVRAANCLATRRSADLLIAGGFDELPLGGHPGAAEGAAFAVLTAGAKPAALALAGWGVAGPNHAAEAIARALGPSREIDGVFSSMPEPLGALAASGADPAHLPLGLVDVHTFAGGAEAAGSAFAFVLAAALIRRGGARRLLVLAVGGSVSCAVIIERDGDGG
jgi:3-oxoacyl-[acyl-carrier-protein] synthase II